jgi:small nuclear ribonucleoprotein (snRNP)-like protein
MSVVAVKRFIANNVSYPTVTDSVELLESGSEKEPVIGDSGEVLNYTESLKAGMIKAKFSTLAQFNTKVLKTLVAAEIICELKDGRTYVGTNMTRTDNNAEIVTDGTIELEFMGNVVER